MIHSDFTLIYQQYGNLHTNMKSYFQKILFICMVNLTFTTMTFSQDIGSEWIDVKGKNTDQIENLMNDQIRILLPYDAMKVKSVEERLNKENDMRIATFSDKKIDLRDNLDNATDNKNDLAI